MALRDILNGPQDTQPTITSPSTSIGGGGLRRLIDAFPEDETTSAIPTTPIVEEEEEELEVVDNDAAMIADYLSGDDPFYDEEYLSSLGPQKLLEVINEEDPALIAKYYPSLTGEGSISDAEIDDISKGAELIPYDPTSREKAQSVIARAMLSSGLISNNFTAQQFAQGVVGNPTAENILNSFGVADITPVGAIFAIQEALRDVERLNNVDAKATSYIVPGLVTALSILEAVPLTKAVAKPAIRALRGGKEPVKIKTVDEILAEAKVKDDAAKKAARDDYNNRKYNVSRAKEATETAREQKTAAAKKKASENQEIKEDMIKSFEDRLNEGNTGERISISTRAKNGKLVIDPDKVRAAGMQVTNDLGNTNKEILKEFFSPEGESVARLVGVGDQIVETVIKPDKFDAMVALAADLKKIKPRAFDNDKTVIDNLFELTVNKDLGLEGDDLIDMLNKYDLSFEEYVVGLVGTGSRAGQVLSKLSQIKRSRPVAEMRAMQEAAEHESLIARAAVMRIENIRRGGLVSQIATAARNLTSGVIRAPLEGVGNVMDTALYRLSEEGVLASAKALSPVTVRKPVVGKGVSGYSPITMSTDWKDSFRHLRYMFTGDGYLQAKEYSDFILGRPELTKQGNMLLQQLNELQASVGRGRPTQRQIERLVDAKRVEAQNKKVKFDEAAARAEATEEANRTTLKIIPSGTVGEKLSKSGDALLSALEDGVEVLNLPNRWQEHLIRRGAFLGELERLVRREWGVDFIPKVNEVGIRDFLNDASSVRPKDGRSFYNIIDDATQRALDITYTKQPDLKVFRAATSFITRNGLTVVIPFPRFMFNSMELMAQYGAGAVLPLTRKIANVATGGKAFKGKSGTGKLTAKERQGISRNVVGGFGAAPIGLVATGAVFDKDASNSESWTDDLLGIAVAGACYQYRTSEDAPSDYKMLRMSDGTMMDTTTQYPLRQCLYIGEAAKQIQQGTFENWFKTKEFADTFIGVNVRVGVGNSLVQEITNLASGTDLTADEAVGRSAGRALGNYLATWMVPFAQVIELERALGIRGLEFKDVAKDPTLSGFDAFLSALARPFRARGFGVSPAEEAAMPAREPVFQEGPERVAPLAKVLLGLTLTKADSEEGEYLGKFGYTDFEIGSRSRVPTVRRFENQVIRNALPTIVRIAKRREKKLIQDYKNANEETRRLYTQDQYVAEKLRPIIQGTLDRAKNEYRGKTVVLRDVPKENRKYVKAVMDVRKLSGDDMDAAMIEFVERNNREPDPKSAADLAEIYKIGKKYSGIGRKRK
tara:strand:+ start:1852 stop:5700 length:3849 start_codon:yes stop_codon:yes gene_type:complete